MDPSTEPGGDYDADVTDLAGIGEVEAPPDPPAPYVFDPDDAEPASRRLDDAYAAAGPPGHWSDVIDRLRGGPPTADTLRSQTPLDRALQTPVLFVLRLGRPRQAPECRLVPQVDTEAYAYPARIREVRESELQLWRELATRVEQPTAQARLHDLLAERRDGNVRQHAEKAVDAYLEVAGQGAGVGVRLGSAEILVRAWEMCRRYGLWDRLPRVQESLLRHAARELDTEAQTPGIVLPML